MRPVLLDMHGFASFREEAHVDFGDADFGKSDVANLSFPLKVSQQAELILCRYVRIDTMQLKQLDTLKP